ncbi:MAG: transposase family protein [Planctomycetes bacterium]|nr:transposase family protein [Planctomycetota bacterium]
MIVRAFPVPVECLSKWSTIPSVDELRPAWCPSCGQPAGTRACGGLGIVGHGSYERQVAGGVAGARDLLVRIRRYLCRGCGRTLSVLPDVLYPRRWYAATTILLALALRLLAGVTAREIRSQLASDGDGRGWKSLDRWRQQLFAPLWSWLGAQVGVPARRTRPGQRTWLRRLLALHGVTARDPTDQVASVARRLGADTAHDGVCGRQLHRDPREAATAR